MPLSLAAVANGASFLMGDSGITTARSDIFGIRKRVFMKCLRPQGASAPHIIARKLMVVIKGNLRAAATACLVAGSTAAKISINFQVTEAFMQVLGRERRVLCTGNARNAVLLHVK